MSRIPVLLAFLLLAASAAHAAAPEAAAPIAALDNALVEIMKAGKATPFAQRYATLEPVVERSFDLDSILETSIGSRWQSFTPAQQQELRAVFARFTIASYVSNFTSFEGERFEIEPDTRAIGAEEVVSTRIVPTSGTTNRLDYVMRQSEGGWRAVDVLLDGTISRVAVQRSDFRSLLGGGPEALVGMLQKKVTDLSGGASVP